MEANSYRGPICRNDRRGRELRAKMLACSKEDDARRAGIQSSTRKRVVRVGVGDGGGEGRFIESSVDS